MRARHTAAALVLALALGGCASMTDTERRAAGGTAMGAAGGAALATKPTPFAPPGPAAIMC